MGPQTGFFVLVILALFVAIGRTKRNNGAAPKNASKPFCVLFTDIQASTHLWATIPREMTQEQCPT